ncbi:hypothetical protein ACIBG5_27075 [Kribbella sp. NPDC050241]|uniref:hypothetical protein n=1 Tax=Kribbella sp. NPDC050241 TaxID=3364115 RepID=UPI0037B3D39D
MAVLLQLTVTPATHEQFDQLDVRVGESMMRAGGPPAGLLGLNPTDSTVLPSGPSRAPERQRPYGVLLGVGEELGA